MGTKTVAEKLLIESGTAVWFSHPQHHRPIAPLPDAAHPVDGSEEAATALPFAADAGSLRGILDEHRDDLGRPATPWVAEPKANQAEIARDTLWPALSEHAMSPIRQVAADEVWSAIRFRPNKAGRRPSPAGVLLGPRRRAPGRTRRGACRGPRPAPEPFVLRNDPTESTRARPCAPSPTSARRSSARPTPGPPGRTDSACRSRPCPDARARSRPRPGVAGSHPRPSRTERRNVGTTGQPPRSADDRRFRTPPDAKGASAHPPRIATERLVARLYPRALPPGVGFGTDWWKRKKPSGSYLPLTRTSRSRFSPW